MKTHILASLLLLPSLLLAQSEIIPLAKKRSDETLISGFKMGAKTMTISAAGTLVWEDGATLTGASFFRSAAGLVIGTDVQAHDADLDIFAGITPSANVQTLLGAADNAAMRTALGLGSMALQSVTNPSVFDKLTVNKTGQSEAGGIEVADDPSNGSVRALFILPPADSNRIYIGKAGQRAYSLKLTNCLRVEDMPYFTTSTQFTIGAVSNTYIQRGDGGTEIGANHPTGYGLDILQDNSYATADLTHRAVNIHRTDGLTVFGASTTRTNYEGINMSWDGTRYNLRPVAGSGGGTVRPVRYWLSGTVWMGAGSGSPEGVETAGIGSIYSDTATGNVYRKTSGTGNTGWVTP